MIDQRDGTNEASSGGTVPPNFSEMLDKVLSNPEIISTVAAALSKGGEETTANNDESAKTLDVSEDGEINQEKVKNEGETPSPDIAVMMQRLPEVMKIVGPMMSRGGGKGVSKLNDKRTCLLNAIKPYLNPHRCEAIDYIIRFSELSELIKTIR